VLVDGKPPYHPRDLAFLYLYGMLNRIRSSRQLEAACYNRIDVIWLMQGQHPDHSTIAEFVKGHGPEIRRLFRDVVRVAVQAQLVKLEHVAVDGTKVEADAAKGSVKKQETIQEEAARLEGQITALEAEWKRNEAHEGRLLDGDASWIPKPTGTVGQRLARMKRQQDRLTKALQAIARRQEEWSGAGTAPQAIASVTDPDSRMMPGKDGQSKPNLNTQIATDSQHGLIVGQSASDAADDSGQLTPLLEAVTDTCGRPPQEASADSAYNTGPELDTLEKAGVTGYLPDTNTSSGDPVVRGETQAVLDKAHRGAPLTEADWSALPRHGKWIDRSAFTYEASTDTYRCPAGHRLPYWHTTKDRKKWGVAERRQYRGSACASCSHHDICCKAPGKGRIVSRDQYEAYRERLRARMRTEAGRDRYRLRRQTVEPRFGHIKHGLGVRRFLHRGLAAVRTEWSLVCTAVNVGILVNHWTEVKVVL
jgi:transposase